MVKVYPVILKETENGYVVDVPDFNINTQGKDLAEAIYMARDAIGLMGIDMEDDDEDLPEPYSTNVSAGEGQLITLVDIDFTEYRRKVDNKAVKKNCTIPSWLAAEAEKEGINFSKALQEALMNKLHIEAK